LSNSEGRVVKKDHKNEIEEIIGQMQCAKDFQCYKSGFEILSKTKDIGLELYLQCLEENVFGCQFSVRFGGNYFCECPLRVYIAKEMKK
jgi:hypothetical protein